MSSCKVVKLRGFHNAQTLKHLYIMGVLVTITGFTYHHTYKKPKKERFAEFYKHFDAEKAAENMRKAGLLQSVPPDPPEKTK